MAQNKFVLHTLMTGEIVLTISIGGQKFASIPMGTDSRKARERTKTFLDVMKDVQEITDQIT